MGRIGRGWQLTKLSFGVIRKNKKLLLFPVISGLAIIILGASFAIPIFLIGASDPNIIWIPMLILGLIFYFTFFIVATFFEVALIGCAMMSLDGGRPTLGYGIGFAAGRFKYIVEWALVAATVGLILRALEERLGFIGKIVIGIAGIAWAIATYFVVPVLAFEKLSPFKAMKRSGSILKCSWGEALAGNLGMGLIFVALAFLGIPFLIIAAIIGGVDGIIVCFLILIVYWVFLGVLASTAQGVLVTALYRYATTGKTSSEIPEQVLANPWRGC